MVTMNLVKVNKHIYWYWNGHRDRPHITEAQWHQIYNKATQ